MLQYPIHLPPLSSDSKSKLFSKDSSDFLRSHDPPSAVNSKRLPRDTSRPSFAPTPLSISTNISSSSTSSPSSPAKPIPRSPYLSSPRPPSTPISLPALSPWKSKLASSDATDQSRRSSVISIDDVLSPGDIIGEGSRLQGEVIRGVTIPASPSHRLTVPDHEEPATQFQVIKLLGTGSYAVVYLVREIMSTPPPSDDGHSSLIGTMDMGVRPPSIEYGREFAIKCLSKANLDEEALASQLSEVAIHQSLGSHPNIASLYRTLETSSYLLLLLEYVPGEDLFYFLEQARDHYELDNQSPLDPSVSSSRTPPTPSLLSNPDPAQLLSRIRLKLIASMFSQMCEAVAACHDQQVFHRDIKPENFIVTDGWTTSPDGRRERKVIVKLTDFGLSTTDLESSDMDCGSAPYMSYECRNNVAPTYTPRAADVWSLGIVLINMLYHYNPWTDTAQGACSSFDLYLQHPISFFMQRFTGMTRPVAEFLANRVFCILHDAKDDSARIQAREFGAWAKELPSLLGDHHRNSSAGHQRVVSTSSTQGHRISSSIIPSHRPSSRQASYHASALHTPALHSRPLSRTPSLVHAFEIENFDLPTVIDQELEEQEQHEEGTASRSQSNKRRKRGARRGKGNATSSLSQTSSTTDATLENLAVASQSLAREVSRASRSSSYKSGQPQASSKRLQYVPPSPPSIFPLPFPYVPAVPPPSSAPPIVASQPTVSKKPSKWKLSFGKNSSGAHGPASPADEVSADVGGKPMSTTASNVTNLIMSLDAPTPHSSGGSQTSDASSKAKSIRGRDNRPRPPPSPFEQASNARGLTTAPPFMANSNKSVERWAQGNNKRPDRGVSPTSTRSGRPLASSASSMTSGNWRSSMSTTSSTTTSTSAFTKFSNSSRNSVSTMATSVSTSSWRTQTKPPTMPNQSKVSVQPATEPTRQIPKNVKFMTGVPWELDQLPRQLHPNPVGDIFGQPPTRKQRARKPKELQLDTINERPGSAQKSSPVAQRRDAMTSTTDLDGINEDGSPKKVQKGQINALAKMLSALRR